MKTLLAICVVIIIGLVGVDVYNYTASAAVPAEELVVNENQTCGVGEGCSISDKRDKGFDVGEQMPNITLKDFNGEETNLYDLMEGKDKFILSFAADWCSDCQRQDAKMKEYYDTLPEDYGFAVVFVDFSSSSGEYTTSLEQSKAFAEEQNYPFPVFWDYDNEISSNFGGIKSTPTNFVLDENAIIKGKTEEIDADILFLGNEEEMYVEDFSKL